ncbi:hypothetical protein HN803_04625 [candidate division WWE3 bacterium]|jgi:hypothetical protein|nr:hypothetical protein [Candidatus Scalindua sp.]MBT7350048.1 hypothetical protein [candidate division WWE3 bacterium]
MEIKDVKDSISKAKRTVIGFAGLVSPDEIQSVMVELGLIDQFFTRKREAFPKHFSILVDSSFVRLQEKTPTDTIYCSDTQYDVIVKAVIAMQERGENFNRFTLPAEIQKRNPEVTSPAVLACLHFWLSLSNPLLGKDKDLFKIRGDIDEFENDSGVAWNELSENDLHVTGRRK